MVKKGAGGSSLHFRFTILIYTVLLLIHWFSETFTSATQTHKKLATITTIEVNYVSAYDNPGEPPSCYTGPHLSPAQNAAAETYRTTPYH